MRNLFLLLAATGIVALSSCSKSSDSASSYSMNYQLKTTNNNVALMRTTATASVVWTAGFANPTMIKFEAKQSGTEIEYKSTNTTQIDLFAPIAASFGGFTLPDGIYTEVELKVELAKNGTSPALQLSGEFTSGTTTIPVLLQVNAPVEIKTETHDVTIAGGSSFTAVTAIDMSAITAGVTEAMLSSASLTGGTIVISSTSNTALYNIILANLGSHRHHCDFDEHHH